VRDEHVVVVGAGIGGLVSALELVVQGLRVTLLERSDVPGGKMRELSVGGIAQDAGPTVMTMPWVFEDLFADLGMNLSEHITLKPLDILARHAWDAEQRLDLFSDIPRTQAAIGDFSGAAEARRYVRFCERAKRVYRSLEQSYICASRPGPVSLVRAAGLRGLADLWQIKPFSSMWAVLGGYFRDPRLQQLFGRYATYCGSSPYQAPATLMLVAHVEQQGVWLVEGGMHRLALALSKLGSKLGVDIRYGTGVSEILVDGNGARGVELEDGERITADAVVFNGDPSALTAGHLGLGVSAAVNRISPRSRSLSAVTWSLLATAEGFPLVRHNVFFSADYAAEFNDILQRQRLPLEPTVYLCAQDRDDSKHPVDAAPERLLCLINAPPTGDMAGSDAQELARCEKQVLIRLRRCGLNLDWEEGNRVLTTPSEFDKLFPATGGALYGQATHGWRASFSRPGADCRIPGLFLAGGGVHPGPGVPMAALSGRLAAATLVSDLVSDIRSQRVVIKRYGRNSLAD
jgi:1-hydroxycarotenoid 3,4-desaturase